ncbi:MAG: hypothetical protein WD607_00790 [Candidatus Paceibacterota bacterium]
MESILNFLERTYIVGRIFKFVRGLWLVMKKDWRLINNLRKPIMLIGSSGKDMSLISNLIKDAGFFRVEDCSDSIQNMDRIKDHSIVIIGYTKGEIDVDKLIKQARSKSIPIIIYSKPGEVSEKDKNFIYEYSYAEIANSSLRLMNLIFSILSVYKYENK